MTWLYDRRLRYPERAESLEGFGNEYEVHLDHWSQLSAAFRDAYQTVYVRGTSRMLIVCGPQGSGKSLFCQCLLKHHAQTLRGLSQAPGEVIPDREKNLWHLLVVDREEDQKQTILLTTPVTVVKTVSLGQGWLEELRRWGREDQSRVRIVLIDNFQRERFLSELAGISLEAYSLRRDSGEESGMLSLVAQSIDTIARGDLQRTLFLCLSNDQPLMEQLVEAVRREFQELPRLHALPHPAPKEKERIVRRNLNRLNPMSYWYCLDRADGEELRPAYLALRGNEGIGRVYECVEGGIAERRAGAPANKNRLTIVTLGATPAAVADEHDAVWVNHPPKCIGTGAHVAMWEFPRFARPLPARNPVDQRRCDLFDSEFLVRWITLDMALTKALVTASPTPGDAGEAVLDLIVGDGGDRVGAIDALNNRPELATDDPTWSASFRAQGSGRAGPYETALRARFTARSLSYSTALPNFADVRPDVTVAPYVPCELHLAASDDPKDLRAALKRTCHVVEFTSFLREGMAGLDEYLLKKIVNYATLLEEV